MSIQRLLRAALRYRPWRLPRHIGLVLSDLLGTARQPERPSREHLEAAVAWLCRAQDVRSGREDAGGVSAGWTFLDGWLPSYPETSGYIVETLLEAAKLLDRPELVARAGRILDWELSIQDPSGAFPGHFNEPGSRPVVFNVGQIIHGLVTGHVVLAREDCLDAAVRACRWLSGILHADGCWRTHTYRGIPHTYNTRTAWAMLRVAEVTGDRDIRDAAARNLQWALGRQRPGGWYEENAFVL